MGLVGCFLSPVANQVSVDYLKTEDFARRPLAWLDLISRNPGTSISYSPTFGYDICARRMSSQTKASDRFDLSRRSEEHTSELQSLMRNSYAVFCLKKKNTNKHNYAIHTKSTNHKH